MSEDAVAPSDMHSSGEEFVEFKEKLKDDVVFTPTGKDGITLKASDAKSSREAVGIWKVGNKAWKVFSKREKKKKNILKDLEDDYNRAKANKVPMGDPSFVQGKVEIGKSTATDGFVLETDFMEGSNFQKGASSFNAALKREGVPKDATKPDYKLVLAACEAAVKVGLRDCQGFIKTGISEPLRFIDVHTGWNAQTKKFNPSGEADALLEAIKAWPTSK